MQTLVYSNGKWAKNVFWENDLGLHRADGVVEVLIAKIGVPFHWPDHYERLIAGCDGYIPLEKLPPESEILEKVKLLMSKEGGDCSIIHVLITSGDSDDLKLPLNIPKLALNIWTFKQPPHKPPSLKTIKEKRRVPQYKLTCDYGTVRRNTKIVQKAGFDSFLYWDPEKGILEGPYENIFFVKNDGSLITPGNGMLPGVTRKVALELARASGIFKKVEERRVDLKDLEDSAEAFLTSTTKGVAPVRRVDDFNFKINKESLTTRLRSNFLQYSENYFNEHAV